MAAMSKAFLRLRLSPEFSDTSLVVCNLDIQGGKPVRGPDRGVLPYCLAYGTFVASYAMKANIRKNFPAG